MHRYVVWIAQGWEGPLLRVVEAGSADAALDLACPGYRPGDEPLEWRDPADGWSGAWHYGDNSVLLADTPAEVAAIREDLRLWCSECVGRDLFRRLWPEGL